jgi:beta-N-acetylhexosaminidase
MKSNFVRINIFLTLSFLIVNCASTNTQKRELEIGKKKPPISENEDVYIPHIKSERKTFFPTTTLESKWVDSVYNQMTFDEQLGQLFMVIAYSNKDTIHTNSIEKLIVKEKIGGVMFLQGGAVRQANITNRFQSKSKLPLFIAIDAEWGLNMRLDSTYRYPFNMTLGAIKDMKLLEKLGRKMGKQNKRMGIQFNFAPVLDINVNPKNPIIGFRSFSESKEVVANCAVALMTGVQSEGVLSTGKHFPGHGDTSVDSHHSLPVINFSKDRLEKVELYPYKRMFDEGLESVMVAHLSVPSIEPREGIPSSISNNVVTNLLKNEMGFDGLVFTDALNMKAATNFKKPGDIDFEAFIAGNDILLCSENVAVAKERLIKAREEGLISSERIETSVKKILKYKYKLGLSKYKPITTQNLVSDLNEVHDDALQYELYENAITVLKNEQSILPIKNLNEKIAYVKLGDDTNSKFLETLKKYTQITEIAHPNIDTINKQLKSFDKVIIGFHKSDKAWKKHDFTDNELQMLSKIAAENKVILDLFTKPYSLLQIQDFNNIKAIVQSYQNSEIAQDVSAQLIFGAIASKGVLPVSIRDVFQVGDGLSTEKLNRLGFAIPENVGMNSAHLNKIEGIVNKAIREEIMPGGQILVARKGKVVYQKSFGFHTYENLQKVQNTDLYDVASLTKIVSTLPNVMQLYDKKKVTLDTHLADILPEFRYTDKAQITFKELLSHYARLQPWQAFYKQTLDTLQKPLPTYYKNTAMNGFTKQVASDLFIRNDYSDTIYRKIVKSKLLPRKEYRYSDYTFIILKHYLEKATGKSLDVLSNEHFFSMLGMNNTMYNPLKSVEASRIVPTEIDTYFRHSLIQGYVHDMEAAMEGGIAAHAGIFSNAMDIAKMMQLYLQKGNYGNHEFFSSKTFDDFNTCWYCAEGNRRGLGFDKPQLTNEGPTCGCVSMSSFGHTGFTGTMTWADPSSEIIYVFLSNRTYPDSTQPNKLAKEGIREQIQRIIQESIQVESNNQ